MNKIINEFKDLLKFLKEMKVLLNSDKIEGFIVIWVLTFLWISVLVILFNKYLKLNEVGDALWGIFGTLISTLVFIVVVQSYKLQKEELKKTTDALEWQEDAMKEQKLQSMTISLLELSQNHLSNFRDTLVASKFSTPHWRDVISLYIQGSPTIEIDIKEWILNNAIYYFRTLKYIESMIIEESLWNHLLLRSYISLLESQVTDNIRSLYNELIWIKTGIDLEKIRFKYLFKSLASESKETKQHPTHNNDIIEINFDDTEDSRTYEPLHSY